MTTRGAGTSCAGNAVGPGLVVDTAESTRAYAHGQIAGFVSLSNAVLFLATIIGLLGLANTLVLATEPPKVTLRNAPATPSVQRVAKNAIGDRHACRQADFAGVS